MSSQITLCSILSDLARPTSHNPSFLTPSSSFIHAPLIPIFSPENNAALRSCCELRRAKPRRHLQSFRSPISLTPPRASSRFHKFLSSKGAPSRTNAERLRVPNFHHSRNDSIATPIGLAKLYPPNLPLCSHVSPWLLPYVSFVLLLSIFAVVVPLPFSNDTVAAPSPNPSCRSLFNSSRKAQSRSFPRSQQNTQATHPSPQQ